MLTDSIAVGTGTAKRNVSVAWRVPQNAADLALILGQSGDVSQWSPEAVTYLCDSFDRGSRIAVQDKLGRRMLQNGATADAVREAMTAREANRLASDNPKRQQAPKVIIAKRDKGGNIVLDDDLREQLKAKGITLVESK